MENLGGFPSQSRLNNNDDDDDSSLTFVINLLELFLYRD